MKYIAYTCLFLPVLLLAGFCVFIIIKLFFINNKFDDAVAINSNDLFDTFKDYQGGKIIIYKPREYDQFGKILKEGEIWEGVNVNGYAIPINKINSSPPESPPL